MSDIKSGPVYVQTDHLESLLSRLDKGSYHYIVFLSVSLCQFAYGFTITT